MSPHQGEAESLVDGLKEITGYWNARMVRLTGPMRLRACLVWFGSSYQYDVTSKVLGCRKDYSAQARAGWLSIPNLRVVMYWSWPL